MSHDLFMLQILLGVVIAIIFIVLAVRYWNQRKKYVFGSLGVLIGLVCMYFLATYIGEIEEIVRGEAIEAFGVSGAIVSQIDMKTYEVIAGGEKYEAIYDLKSKHVEFLSMVEK